MSSFDLINLMILIQNLPLNFDVAFYNWLKILPLTAVPIRHFSQKKSWQEPQNRPLSPNHQTTPSKSLDQGLTSLVLVGYKGVLLRTLCVRSITLCICLLLLLHHFNYSYHVSFCYVSLVFVLILQSMEGVGS